uniref:Phosphatidic acid phosphatase type 2/haloperoxidase domain-containing protein n=1 Tax=Alexandrium catenella TaxID=2925 RepID=A0A7S1PS69_ALECA|mmetsp:Transcript_110896/g.294651  ORF Transcript_110896/g.294651 Transcript_110896/m.294651 type:complete len:382 (+) Transcript_110896:249-1394(+)
MQVSAIGLPAEEEQAPRRQQQREGRRIAAGGVRVVAPEAEDRGAAEGEDGGPGLGGGARGGGEPGALRARTFWQHLKQSLYDSLGFLQLAPFDEPSIRDFCGYLAVWSLLMLPVPMSRIQLSDHSPFQTMVGTAIGAVMAILWYLVISDLQHKNNHLLGKRWPKKCSWAFEHNFALPCYVALMRCNPFSIRPRDGSARRFERSAPPEGGGPGHSHFPWLSEAISELEWYRAQTLRRRDDMQHMGTLSMLEDQYLAARECRITELIGLLRLELWLAQALEAVTCEAAAIQRFAERLTAPEPEGLGIQSLASLQRSTPGELRAAWHWEEERGLLWELCAGCEQNGLPGIDGAAHLGWATFTMNGSSAVGGPPHSVEVEEGSRS